MNFEFASQSAQRSDDLGNTSERLVNLYPEIAAQGSKAGITLRSVLGLEAFADLGFSLARDVVELNGVFYACASGRLLSVTSSGTVSTLATLNDDPQTSMSSNGAMVTIAAGNVYYVWDGATLTTPGSGRIANVGWVDFHDGYTLLIDADSGEFEWTSLGDPKTRNGLFFAEAESQNDKLLRSQINGKEVWLFGEQSSEVWQNTGLSGANAFRNVTAIDRGILGRRLATRIAEVQIIVGDDGVVYQITGFQMVPVSTPAVENAISESAPTHVFAYEDRGRKFAVVRFSDRPAWVLDLTTRRWHERASGIYEGAFTTLATARLGKQWYGLDGEGNLRKFQRTNQDGAAPLVRTMQSKPIYLPDGRSVDEVELFGEFGASNIGRDAQVALRVSRDGGVTWDPEQWRSMGTLGGYRTKAEWHALGSAYGGDGHMALQFIVTDPADVNLYGIGRVAVS